MKELTFAVIGYGNRGHLFANLLKGPHYFSKIIAIAESNSERAEQGRIYNNLSDDMVFSSAEEFLKQPKLADAVIITTMDRDHFSEVIPAMKKGYHVLLEKPMAVTLEECEEIEKVQRETGVIVSVAHSLRYNNVYQAVKNIIDSGAIGTIASIDQLEGIGDVHFSSSYIRGNWGNSQRSTFMLLAKSCHDIDLMSYLVDQKCKSISSYGSLMYFKPSNKPEHAPAFCLDGCPHQLSCPYACHKVYLEIKDWQFVFDKKDEKSIQEYLKTGPYGRCVWQCDNDVCDHQVVSMEYENGATGTLTVTAFHPGGRMMRVHGTKGFIDVDLENRKIRHTDFATKNNNTITIPPAKTLSHGGGDALILDYFCTALRENNPERVLTDVQESLESHKIVFAAEKARLTGQTIKL